MSRIAVKSGQIVSVDHDPDARITKLEKTIRARARMEFIQTVDASFADSFKCAAANDSASKLLSEARNDIIRKGQRAAEDQALEQFLAAKAPEVLTPAPISLDALYSPIQIRIGAKGERLPDTATDYVAVLLPQFDLLYSVHTASAPNWKAAVELGKQFELFGDKGEWQLWDDIEVGLTIDRSTHAPAVLPAFRANTPTDDWYWTRRTLASPSDNAIYVNLHSGDVNWLNQYYSGRVRFCRRVRASQF